MNWTCTATVRKLNSVKIMNMRWVKSHMHADYPTLTASQYVNKIEGFEVFGQ